MYKNLFSPEQEKELIPCHLNNTSKGGGKQELNDCPRDRLWGSSRCSVENPDAGRVSPPHPTAGLQQGCSSSGGGTVGQLPPTLPEGKVQPCWVQRLLLQQPGFISPAAQNRLFQGRSPGLIFKVMPVFKVMAFAPVQNHILTTAEGEEK